MEIFNLSTQSKILRSAKIERSGFSHFFYRKIYGQVLTDIQQIENFRIENIRTLYEMELYDYWGIKAQDERGRMQLAVEKAMQDGLQKGRQKGEYEKALEIARKMSADGLSTDLIIKYSGLQC